MKEVLNQFDTFLAQKGMNFEATMIGGAALIILDVISRTTKDIDFLDPTIPKIIKEASREFAEKYPEHKLDRSRHRVLSVEDLIARG